MTLKEILLGLFLLIGLNSPLISANAQDFTFTQKEPDYQPIPPSPQVEALIKIDEVGVDLYKGTPQISVPIFTLVSGGIEVPISLSYNGSGRRLDEEPNSMGYNWTLSASSVISRTVFGHPDEMNQGAGTSTVTGLFNLQTSDKELRTYVMGRGPIDHAPYEWDHQKDSIEYWGPKGIRYYRGECDMANDLFHISGCGLSGVFAFTGMDLYHPICLSSPQWLGVSPSQVSDSYPMDFIIKDSQGKIYSYADRDSVQYKVQHGLPDANNDYNEERQDYTSDWNLSSITDVSGNQVKFSYIKTGFRARTTSQFFQRTMSIDPQVAAYAPEAYTRTDSCMECYLSKIEAKNAIAKFCYTSLSGPRLQLRKIEIYHVSDTLTPQITYRLNFSEGAEDLVSVTRNDLPYYSFQYQESYDGYNFREWTTSQDFGGYYNGADNTSLVPSVADDLPGGNADRSVHVDYAGTGCLNKITYPSGAEVTITWENHIASNLNATVLPYEAQISTSIFDTGYLRYCSDNPNLTRTTFTLTVKENQVILLDMNHYFDFDPTILYGSEYYSNHYVDIPTAYPLVEIWNITNGETLEMVIYLDNETFSRLGTQNVEVIKSPGNYEIKLLHPMDIYSAYDSNFSETLSTYFSQNCGDGQPGRIFIKRRETTYPESEDETMTYARWPGARIQRIYSNPKDGTLPICKDYYYPGYQGEQGVAQHYPNFYHNAYLTVRQPVITGYSIGEIRTIESNGLPNTPLGGNEVEYPKVMVVYSNGNSRDLNPGDSYNRHREIYEFTSLANRNYWDIEDDPGDCMHAAGSKMLTSKAHWRGNLVRKTLSTTGSTPMTIQETDYNIVEKYNPPTLTTDFYWVADFSHSPTVSVMGLRDYYVGRYKIIPYSKTVKTERTIIKEENGTLTDSVTYEYYRDPTVWVDSPWREMVKTKTSHDALGNTYVTHYTYKSSGNAICPVPESEITVVNPSSDNIVVEAVRREFDGASYRVAETYTLSSIGESADGLWTSSHELTAAGLALVNDHLFSYRYNSDNNLVEILLKGRPYAAYLWGYDGTYPLVEVKNMSYADLTAALAQAGTTPSALNSLADSSRVKTALDNLREQVTDADISTFTYHPLIGILTATDATGNTVTYDYYPNSMRLKEVLDFNQRIISHHDYYLNGIKHE